MDTIAAERGASKALPFATSRQSAARWMRDPGIPPRDRFKLVEIATRPRNLTPGDATAVRAILDKHGRAT